MARLKLKGGEIALIDDEDVKLVASFCDYWYAQTVYTDHHHHIPVCTDPQHNHVHIIASNKKRTRLHRLISGFDNVDFVDFNGLNNRRSNLEPSGATQMGMSSPKKKFKRGTTSQYKGVSWNKSMAKWKAQIYHNNKVIVLGYYKGEVSAAVAYDKAARELFGKYAHPNFPESKQDDPTW